MKNSLIIFCFYCLFSCNNLNYKREKTHEITQFKRAIYDTLNPIKEEHYGAKSIEVIGYTDDTIAVSFGKGYRKHYLTKKIDTIISTDYYGNEKATFTYEPYNAKKGKLKIKFRI